MIINYGTTLLFQNGKKCQFNYSHCRKKTFLVSPLTTSATCLHEIPSDGWLYCSGELISNGICTEYDYDNTVNWTCN